MQKLEFPSERIVSLAFDVISRVLETGPVSSITFLVYFVSVTLVILVPELLKDTMVNW